MFFLLFVERPVVVVLLRRLPLLLVQAAVAGGGRRISAASSTAGGWSGSSRIDYSCNDIRLLTIRHEQDAFLIYCVIVVAAAYPSPSVLLPRH